MSLKLPPDHRPPIVLRETDAERLSNLASQMEASGPLAARLLLDEIDRADIRPDHLVPDTIIGMQSVVEFVDEAHDLTRTVTLVYPTEADISSDTLHGLRGHQAIGEVMASEAEEVLKGIIEQALKDADDTRAERVTIRVGALQLLWEKFEERGLALKPFADLVEDLGLSGEDDLPLAASVTLGDLRAAKRAVS